MKRANRNITVICVTGVVAACVLAAVAMKPQPAGDDLPPGFSRDAATGAISVTAPPAVRFDPTTNEDHLLSLTTHLSVRSFSLDTDGYVKSFTVNSRLGNFPDGTLLMCRSVTLRADGTLESLVLAENAASSGYDMKVVIDGGVTTYSCSETTCTTVCDTQMVKDPETGIITITCNCRATP
ncbi:MAG: hypothetical protein KF864_03710 [Phycisphaeraceae bacterium]|nr:hypothetical protein [Phycisphaeraceae bacterium]